MMRALLAFLLLFPLSFAGCGIMDEDADSAFLEAMPIISAAIMLSVLVAAIAYMAGSFTRNPQLLVFSKDQIFHTFVSVLLVVSIEGIFFFTCIMASQAAGGVDMQGASINYLRALHVEGGQMLTTIMKRSIDYKFDAVDFFGYQVPFLGGETFWYNAYKNAYSRHLEIVFDMVMVGYVSAGVQYNIMSFLPRLALGIMVPLGLVIRCIPKAREAGNMVIAVALAIYVVIPFTYAVHSTMRDTPVPWYSGEMDETGISFEQVALYMFQTIFLPNLSLVIFATAVGGLMKVAKVIP